MRKLLKPIVWWGAWIVADVAVAVGQGLIAAALERRQASRASKGSRAKPKRRA